MRVTAEVLELSAIQRKCQRVRMYGKKSHPKVVTCWDKTMRFSTSMHLGDPSARHCDCAAEYLRRMNGEGTR